MSATPTGTSPEPRETRGPGDVTDTSGSRTDRPARRRGKGPRPERLLTHRMARWIDDRLGSARFVRTALNKVFPDHWSFMIGELGLYCFVVLVLTGVYLTFFFDPSSNLTVYEGSYGPLRGVEMTEAYHSALELSFDVRAGLVMRQIHHWAALLFLAAIAVHLGRVFFTRLRMALPRSVVSQQRSMSSTSSQRPARWKPSATFPSSSVNEYSSLLR